MRLFKHKIEKGVFSVPTNTTPKCLKCFAQYEGDISPFYCVYHRVLEASPCYPHLAQFRMCNLHPQPEIKYEETDMLRSSLHSLETVY